MADPATKRFAVDPRWIVVATVLTHWVMILVNDIGITVKFLGVDQALYGLGPRLIEVLVGGVLLWGLFTRHVRIAAILLGLVAALAVAGAVAYAGLPGRFWAWVHVVMALVIVAAAFLTALRRPEARAQ